MSLGLSGLALLATLALAAPAAAQTPWERVAATHQTSNWDQVEVIRFTFKHSRGMERTHEWWVKRNVVRVTMDGQTLTIPVAQSRVEGEAELAAHKAFINDSFWLLFEFHVGWDDVRREDLGLYPSPFGGKAPAFRITYPPTGGHTPGDAYIGFLGQDGKVMGWAYHKGGEKKPTVVALRGGYREFGPLTLPTRFEKPSGELILEFVDVEVRAAR